MSFFMSQYIQLYSTSSLFRLHEHLPSILLPYPCWKHQEHPIPGYCWEQRKWDSAGKAKKRMQPSADIWTSIYFSGVIYHPRLGEFSFDPCIFPYRDGKKEKNPACWSLTCRFLLTEVSGVGGKTTCRVILELSDLPSPQKKSYRK